MPDVIKTERRRVSREKKVKEWGLACDLRYTIGYTYHIGGQLKSYTDPNGREIKYTHDKIGRLSTVTGTLSSATTEYADNPHYRAWGALTHLDYGNWTEMNVGGFNNKLQATTFELKRGSTQLMSKAYSFHTDGQVKLETDNLNSKFNRSYMFDHVGRIQQARSGAEATGGTATAANIPYKNDFQYTAFGDQTQNAYTHFTRNGTVSQTITNNRVYGGHYDAEGNQTMDPTFTTKGYYYDAANNLSKTTHEDAQSGQPFIYNQEFFSYDGDGYLVKTATSHQVDQNPAEADANYTIRSSLLKGEVISTVNSTGAVSSTYVRANGTVVAIEGLATNPIWTHKDPNFKSIRSTDHNGNIVLSGPADVLAKELDITGSETGFEDPYTQGFPDPNPGFIEPFESFGALANAQNTTHVVDGMQVPRNHFNKTFDFAFQGFFGFIERQAQISARPIGYKRETRHLVRRRSGPPTLSESPAPRPKSSVPTASDGESEIYGTLTTTIPIYSNNWAMNSSLLPQNENPVFFHRLNTEKELWKKVSDIVYYARDSKACAEAFKAAGATPVNEQILNTTIVTEGAFSMENNDINWTRGSDIGQRMRAESGGWFSTNNDLSWPGPYGDTGWRFIGLTNRAIAGTDDHLSVIIIHSLIHSGGIPGQDISTWSQRNISGNVPHDLKHLGEKYKDILFHCTRERFSKALFGQ